MSPGSGLAPAVVALSQATTELCHYRNGQGDYVLQTVNDNAVSGHLSHGDGFVGGSVPAMPTKYFGPACELLDIVEVLINGSFELGPPMTGNEDVDALPGSTEIPGWNVFGTAPADSGAIDYTGPPWDVSDGVHCIDLDGRNALFSGVDQTFATVPGATYTVSFDLSGNPGGPPTVKQVRVAVDNFTRVTRSIRRGRASRI